MAGFLTSIWLLALFIYLWRGMIAFVTEEHYELPKIMFKIVEPFSNWPKDIDTHVAFMGFNILLIALTIFICNII